MSLQIEVPEPSFDFYEPLTFEDSDDIYKITNLQYLIKDGNTQYLIINLNKPHRGAMNVPFRKVEEHGVALKPPDCPECGQDSGIYEGYDGWECENDECPVGVHDREAQILDG